MWQEGVMGGGGDDWYNVILLTVTPGVTVTITDGDEEIEIVGTGSQQAATIHNENATYTITANENGLPKSANSVTTDSTSGKLFIRELKMAAIEVTFDDDFRSESFTISDGTTTSTAQTFPASGNTMDIFVPNTGTWKVYSTVSGDSYDSAGAHVTDLDGAYVDEIHVIPVGATVTPVNDIQLWLECAAIRNKPYTKLEEVLADEITLIKLMSDSNAVDYLKRSTDWITNKTLIPIMTDDTHPSGVASSSSQFENGNSYRAFDGDDENTFHIPAVNSTTSVYYLQYEFDTAKIAKAVEIKCNPYTFPEPYILGIKGSNDGFVSDEHDLGISLTLDSNVSRLSSYINNDTAYKYYRLYAKSGPQYAHVQNQYGLAVRQFSLCTTLNGICENELAMQAIGAYDYAADTLLADSSWGPAIIESEYVDDVCTDLVPLMTSNTTPKGEASSSSNYDSSHTAYKAFDNDSTSRWDSSINSQPQWLRYKFDSAKKVMGVRITNSPQAPGIKVAKLQGSSDNFVSDTHDIGNCPDCPSTSTTPVSYKAYMPNNTSYEYYQVYITDAHYVYSGNWGAIIGELELLGHEVGGVQSWLKAAGISKPYTTLDEVIADSDTLATLVTNHDAVDYLVTAKGLIDGITSSPKAMRYIGYRNYCADTLLADSEWCDAIFNSEYMDSVLNTRVPYMTSDTTPEGVVSASSIYNTNYAPWYVFTPDSNVNYWTAGSTVNQWLQYEFPEDVKVYYAKQRLQGTYPAKNYKYQASDDGTTFADITDVVTTQYQTADWDIVTKVRPADVDDYKYYRLYVIDSHSSYLGVKKLQFYGRRDVDESKIHILSAASDAVKDVTSGTAVTLCTTDTDGHYAINRTDMPVGTYKLESTVALDPEGNMSTDLYQKEVNVTNDTVEITVMPEEALYWFGYEDPVTEDCSVANGWGGSSNFVALTRNTDNLYGSTSGTDIWAYLGLKDKKNIHKMNMIAMSTVVQRNAGISATGYNTKNVSDYNVQLNGPVQVNANTKEYLGFPVGPLAKALKKYAAIGPVNGRAGYIYAWWLSNRNHLANFFGAANDTVVYESGSSDIWVCDTNEFGEAVVDFNSIPSGVILKSSVAKDPTNLSNPYTKLFVPPVNDRFYFMPDNALYWYGYMSDDCEECTTENGWETGVGSRTLAYPTYNINSVRIATSSTQYGGISNKNPLSERATMGAIVQGVSGTTDVRFFDSKSFASTSGPSTTFSGTSLQTIKLSNGERPYVAFYSGASPSCDVFAFWLEKHDTKSNFFSAANDRVYYLDGATPVYVAETNGAGEAWLDLTKIPNGVTLYSSIAKDLTNPSQPFGKTFSVGSDGKFYLMPDGEIIYWYGLELKKIATARQSGAGTVTKNKNNMTISPKTGSSYTSVDLYTENLIDLSAYDNLNMMVQYDNTSSGWYRLGCDVTLSNWTGGYGPTTYEQITPSTTAQKASLNISSLSDSEYCGYITDVNNTTTVYALWLD